MNSLGEDYRLVPVKQHAVFNVPAHRTREHYFFQIAALLQQVFERVAMGDAYHILLNDGAVIEYVGHVVAGSSNQLNPTLESLVVRLCADKCRQE